MTYQLEIDDEPAVVDNMTKFRSRKWRLTLLILLVAVSMTAVGMLSAELTQVLTALGVSYNGAQGLIDWQNTKYHD